MLKIIINWIQQHVIATIVVSVLVISAIATPIILLNSKDMPKEDEKQFEDPQTVILKDDLSFEINSEVKLLSLISEDNKVKVVSENETIDTSVLGEKEITIKYEIDEKEEEMSFKITIVDTQKPTIEYQKELTTTVGVKIDLLKDIKISDNSKEEIRATIEGEYDINKEGTYNLKYVAVDSSNNKVEEEFTLKVNKKATTGNNNATKPETNPNNTPSNSTSNNINEEELDAEVDRLEAIRKSKSVLYTYDPTNEINSLTKVEYQKYIEPMIYKRVFYYTCELVDVNSRAYVTKCDGGSKGCNEVAVKQFKELHPNTECDMDKGISPQYTYYVHSGYMWGNY